MRSRFTRLIFFVAAVILIGYLCNLYFVYFTGDGKDTPQEALPTDAQYEWIEGPKSDKEQRYFFLADGNYFGTGTVIKNLKGWSEGDGSFSPLPSPLEKNKITAAYSDSEILFGLIKPDGNIKISVNEEQAELINFTTLSDEVIKQYQVEGYYIWYIELSKLEQNETYHIEVLDNKDTVLSELTI